MARFLQLHVGSRCPDPGAELCGQAAGGAEVLQAALAGERRESGWGVASQMHRKLEGGQRRRRVLR